MGIGGFFMSRFKIRKERIFVLILILILLLSSCTKIALNNNVTDIVDNRGNQQTSDKPGANKENTNSINNSLDNQLGKAAEKLLMDLREYYKKLENNYSDYYLVMASCKINGLLSVYKQYINDADLNWIIEKKTEIDNRIGDSSTIYFGYLKSGVFVIALTQPQISHNYDFEETMNKIRGTNDEANLLNDINFLEHKGYYAIDIYADNLLGCESDVKINVSISDSVQRGDDSDGGTYKPIINPQDEALNDILKRYGRSVDNDNKFTYREWKLYLFEKGFAFPDIKIVVEDEEIILSN